MIWAVERERCETDGGIWRESGLEGEDVERGVEDGDGVASSLL